MTELSRKQTTITDAQLRAAIDRLAPELTRQQRAHILAWIVVETARRPIRYNLGNLTLSEQAVASGADHWRPPWYTLDEDSSSRDIYLHDRMLDGKAPAAFRAYTSLEEGLAAMLKLLGRAHYDPLMAARSPEQWLEAIASTSYAPDVDVSKTLPGYTSLVQRFGGVAGPGKTSGHTVGGVDVEASAAAVALLGLLGYGLGAWARRPKS